MELKYIEKNVIKQVCDKKVLFVAKEDNIIFNFKTGEVCLILSQNKLLTLKSANFNAITYAFKNKPNKKLERNINMLNRKGF